MSNSHRQHKARVRRVITVHKERGGKVQRSLQSSLQSSSSQSRRAPIRWTEPMPLPKGTEVLYIAPPNGSSVTHFWHFMMGEFIPVVATYLACRPRPRVVHVYKTNVDFPLNAFYQEFSADDRQFVVSAKRHAPKANYHKLPIHRDGWDWYHSKHDLVPMLKAVRFLRTWALGDTQRSKNSKPDTRVHVCVQLRTNTQVLRDYYANLDTKLAKRKLYGADRRCVTNLEDVANALHKYLPSNKAIVHTVVDDGFSLREQICQYTKAQVLVLGHGAGMVHALWMRPPVTIVEIINRNKIAIRDGAVQGCKRLVRILTNKRNKARLCRIVVQDAHAAVNVDAVVKHVTMAVDNTYNKTMH